MGNNQKTTHIPFSLLLLAFAGALVVIFSLYIFNVKNTVNEKEKEDVLETISRETAVLQSVVESAASILKNVAGIIENQGDMESEDVPRLLQEAEDALGAFELSLLVPGEGYLSGRWLAQDVPASSALAEMAGDDRPLLFEAPAESGGGGVIVFAVPVTGAQGLRAVLTAQAFEEGFAKTLPQPLSKDFENACIIDGTGEIVLSFTCASGWQRIAEKTDVFSRLSADAETAEAFRLGLESGAGNALLLNPSGGEEKFIAYSPIAGTDGWYYLAHINRDHLIVDRVYRLTLVLFLLFMLIVLFYFFLALRGKVRIIAFLDGLTGISNFDKFVLDADRLLRKNEGKTWFYVNFDIDHFKQINNIFGLEGGDGFLKHIAACLGKRFSRDGIYARVSADEFVILFEAPSEKEAVSRLKNLSRDICGYKNTDDRIVDITVSYGIYRVNDAAVSVEEMNDLARVAKKSQNERRENTYLFYNTVFGAKLEFQNRIEREMHLALESGQFEIFLQPKYDVKTLGVTGAEALVRWNHPELGVLTPGSFIPLFEKNGFILKLDLFVLESVCKKTREWIDRGYDVRPISVNISRVNFYVENFEELFLAVINHYSLPVNLIEIEITESAFMGDMTMMASRVNKLKGYGFSILLDDFGVGYSSLNSIRHLPIDVLKIDRGFFNDGFEDEISVDVINGILDISQKLGIKTIAEGVETRKQFELLKKSKCDAAQGYFLSRPMDCGRFEDCIIKQGCLM